MSKALGIIMLDTTFERPAGDAGNAASWPFPVLFRTVRGAGARAVVDGRETELLDGFVEAGEELVRQGACALTTSCGFLVLRQGLLSARLGVPLATSSLLQVNQVSALLPSGKTAGVITYDSASLTHQHFLEAGIATPPPVAGLPENGAFRGLIEGGERYDRARLERELMDTIADLLDREPSVGALVFECTNLPPFSQAATQRFGLPVFDILTLGRWLYAGTSGIR